MAKKQDSGKPAKPGARRKSRKAAETSSRGLTAAQAGGGALPGSLEPLVRAVEEAGGRVAGSYRDPLGGRWQLLALLPLDKVAPTPFQRDISETHVERLASVLDRMDRYLDPIIAVQDGLGGFWTPNGNHRLSAMRKIGARSIAALILPEPEIAYRILALNTEKSHNLREKALEVVRMARSLAERDPRPEKDCSLEFEEPAFLTLGIAYERRGRFAGGAYNPVLRRVEAFLDEPLPQALEIRGARVDRLLELDDRVGEAVAALKERGFESPYLKAFVVARLNPLRFRRGASMPPDAALEAMLAAAAKFDAGKIAAGDLASAGGAPAEE